MKFEFPTFKLFLKILIVSVIVSVAGYFLFPALSLDTLSNPRGFAYGLLAGGIISGLLISTKATLAANAQVESIFVGNLAFKTNSHSLRELFEQYGDVHAVRLMTDRATRRSRGFGFVEMKRKDAQSAIRALNGKEFHGRELKVNIANERKANQDDE